jgi:hypothetical protein
MFNRDQFMRSIAERLPACSDDELRVLGRVLDGIEQGRIDYGPLDVMRDVRDWRREGSLELRDWIFYFAAHDVAADARIAERHAEALRRPTVIEIPPLDDFPLDEIEPDKEHGGEG